MEAYNNDDLLRKTWKTEVYGAMTDKAVVPANLEIVKPEGHGGVSADDTPQERLIKNHLSLCDKAREIMGRKNHDYCGGVDGDPFANFRGSDILGISPVLGILLRMQDKMMRIKTFSEKGELRVQGEGLEDAVIDLINYSILIYGMLDHDGQLAPF